jgi:hypothetical protein
MLEGYSRTILAGMASEHQDMAALLQLLYAALSTYGCPEGSDIHVMLVQRFCVTVDQNAYTWHGGQ